MRPSEQIINVLGTARQTVRSAGQIATLTRLQAAAVSSLGNNAVTNADMATPPTVTFASTTNASLTVKKYPSVDTTLFTLTTGFSWRRATNSRLFCTHNTMAPGTTGNLNASFTAGTGAMLPDTYTSADNGNNWDARFVTSSDVVEIEFQPSASQLPYRFIVDEGSGPAYLTPSGLLTRAGVLIPTTASQFVTLTFGSQIARTITIEAQGGTLVGGVAVKTGFTITAPGGTVLRAGGIGDSFIEAINQGTYDASNNPTSGGTTKFFEWDGMGTQFCRRVGITHFMNNGLGGTGYAASGATQGTRSIVRDQIDYFKSLSPLDMYIFAGGYNDAGKGFTTDAGTAALALQSWQKIRAAYPNALIVVFGPWGGRTGPAASQISLENQLKTTFDGWNDFLKMWIPVTTDSGGAWLTGTGRVGATTGVGNCDIYMSDDTVHPNRNGHSYLGGKMDTAYRAQIATL